MWLASRQKIGRAKLRVSFGAAVRMQAIPDCPLRPAEPRSIMGRAAAGSVRAACGAQSLSKDGRFRSGFCGCATPLCPGATAKRTAHRFSRDSPLEGSGFELPVPREIADLRTEGFLDRVREWEHAASIRIPIAVLTRLYPRTLDHGTPDLIENSIRLYGDHGDMLLFEDFPTNVFTRSC
jgi:hypothetical protein